MMWIFENGKKYCNVNLDSDGIVSYLLMKKIDSECTISGYNTSDDYIYSIFDNEDDMWYKSRFIDLYTPKESVYGIDQHVIYTDSDNVSFMCEKLNPHLLIENHYAFSKSYLTKYPFSTSLFLMTLCDKEGVYFNDIEYDADIYSVGEGIKFCDLLLRCDGCLLNYARYKDNVLYWIDKTYEYIDGTPVNTECVFSYLTSLSESELYKKTKTISGFYISKGLTKDGGYNKNKDFTSNISTINTFMRSFAKYMNVSLDKTQRVFYQYKGETGKTDDIRDFDPHMPDTYAYVRKYCVRYTNNIILDKKYGCVEVVM